MGEKSLFGFMGQIIRIDLSEKKAWSEILDEEVYWKYVGGVSPGAKYLCEEVPPHVEWSLPENRLIPIPRHFVRSKSILMKYPTDKYEIGGYEDEIR